MFQAIRNFLKKHRQGISRDPAKLYPHDFLFQRFFLPLIPPEIHPNHVTVLRFLFTPFVLWFLAVGQYEIGVPLFFFTAFTDALDGSLARVRGQITAWGTLYDPVADKILIGSVVLLVVYKHLHPSIAILILLVEVMIIIGGYRHTHKGKILSANVFGKTKMFLQVTGVLFLLIALWFQIDAFTYLSIGTLSVSILFAFLSMLTYGI
ncbi:MAG: CDP-alcohol phosphatidyltransferase [Candidatus Uhrbacteria bacterium GW2011_GWF2_41_16]|uniref:CDP-alcohol phosphatidyltransferase n=1 Tax=Candidatus Uhrbacteria bacterium GW2011_GWF2_41_16 TaxID=1618997 RepID=A0A0G0V9L6_9BACT|nr:MAG: CDP-alcohol phosphatidyltransferase [Candidatus Uhrbacteria bacterium GW2011_GWA2_41_10]KKR97624.1 MAG: CDP-alcohol phosphatidyltransferase [Candidatus Uhrbacteria bacterium GW2011_GWF2_41_16]